MKANILKNGEFGSYLYEINVKRAFISSVILSFIIPAIMVYINVMNLDSSYRRVIIIFSFIATFFQIAYSVILYCCLKNRNSESFYLAYLIYFGVTIVSIMYFAAIDMNYNKSEILYVASCIYLIFIPIFNEKVRYIFIFLQTIVMISLMILVHMSQRSLFDTAIIQLCTTFISTYQNNLTIRIVKTSKNLRMKTLYSEQDALTGLTNRRGLERKAMSVWPICTRRKIPVGIIALDIDYFKKYNDKFGHPQGDECLKMIAEKIKESARDESDIVTRTGGEEFLIFIQNITPKEILEIALKIRKSIESLEITHAYCGISKYVTVSIGISTTIPKLNYRFNDLYEEADKALYLAKKNGRNCIVFNGNLYGRMKNGFAQIINLD